MDITRNLIFLLRSVICGEGGAALPDPIDGNALRRLYLLSKRHDLAQVVGAALDKMGLLSSAEDQKTVEMFRKEQTSAIFRCENLDFETAEICRVLDKSGIDHIPLKGAVIRELYPESWMRTSCDVDVLVHESDLASACGALTEKLGYSVEGDKDYHDISLTSPSGFHLELHYSIKENIDCMDKTLEKVWDYAKPLVGHRYALTDEFMLLHYTTHASYHFVSGGCGIRPVIDLYYLRQALSPDEGALRSLLEECGLLRFYESINKLCDHWFCGGEADETTREMAGFIINGGVYGSVGQKIAVTRTEKSRAEYLRSRIFLPYNSLKILYPQLEGRRALTPMYQVARWGKLCRGDVRRSVGQEVRTSANLNRGEIERARKILHSLGLEELLK